MIERLDGEITLICDGTACGMALDNSYEDSPDQFRRMINEARNSGWKVRQDGADWEHHCPDCQVPGASLAETRKKFGLDKPKTTYDPDIEELL